MSLQNQDIAKKIADLLAKGEKVYSNAIGRAGTIIGTDGPAVYIKLKNGRKGVTSFRGNHPVVLEKVAGGWVVRDAENPFAGKGDEAPVSETIKAPSSINGEDWVEKEVFYVYIPANVYSGKYYNHEGYRFKVPVTDEVKTEQDAINWVNSHKQEVLKYIDGRKSQSGKRMVKSPVDKNVFFKDKYAVTGPVKMSVYSPKEVPVNESIKSLLKKIIISEMTQNQFGTPAQTQKKDEEAEKELKKATGVEAEEKPGTGKVSSASPKHHVELSRNADDNYDVVSYTNESDRKIARGVKLEDAMELVKNHAKDTEKSYVEKAREKSINGGDAKKDDKKKDEKSEDKMEEVDETKQVEIADKNDKKAEEKPDKKLTPAKDELSAQMGGEFADKVEKIIDRVLKKNTVKLKADPDMESPDKRVVKVKETPELKEKK